MILGIHAPKETGKDTFYKFLKEIQPNYYRFAFADALKRDLAPLISEKFGIDVFNPTKEQKTIIRDILIAYGCAWRAVDINHWVKVVDELIISCNEGIPESHQCITDVRFPSEAEFFKEKYGSDFFLLNLEPQSSRVEPTDEEKKHIETMRNLADLSIKWPDVDNLDDLKPLILETYHIINQQE